MAIRSTPFSLEAAGVQLALQQALQLGNGIAELSKQLVHLSIEIRDLALIPVIHTNAVADMDRLLSDVMNRIPGTSLFAIAA